MQSTDSGPNLNESQLFRLLVQSVTDYAIFALDPNGNIVSWNEGAERLNGYSTDEAIGRHFSIFYTPLDLEVGKPSRVLKAAAHEGKFHEEGWRIRKDQSAYWAEAIITPIRDDQGNILGFAKVTRDITEQKIARDGEQLRLELATIAANLQNFDELLQAVISSVGRILKWEIGHAYVWNPQAKLLQSAKTWYFGIHSVRFQDFIHDSEARTFAPGEGLPGQVYDSKKTIVVRNFEDDSNYPRLKTFKNAEILTGIGIPIFENDKIFAVIEFFSTTTFPDTHSIQKFGETLGQQISRFVERQRLIYDQELFFETSLDLLAWAGFDGYFKRINSLWTEVLGYSEEELLNNPYLHFVHPDDRSPTISTGDASTRENIINFENRYRCKDGSYRWLQWHSLPIPEREMIYAIARDITDEKAKEVKLQEALTLRNTVLDSTSSGIICVDLLGIVTVFNRGAEKLFGYDASEFVGQKNPPSLTSPELLDTRSADISHVLGKETQATLYGFFELAQSGLENEFEWSYIRKDGSKFPALLNITALRNDTGEMTGYMGLIRDISARKEAEADRNRLLAIIEQSPDFIGFSNDKNQLLFQNVGGNRMLGYPDDYEPGGKRVAEMHPEWVLALGRDEIQPALDDVGFWIGETEFYRVDGSIVPTYQAIFNLPSEGDEDPYIATIARDISDLKRSEALLAHQAEELRISNQELEQFAYVASHDLQEPLRMVCSFLGLLQLEFDDKLNDDAREYIRYAVDGGMRMRALINGLLDFSRVGRQDTEMVPVSMEAVFDEVRFNLHLAAEEVGAEITCDPLPDVIGDQMNLTQLVQNLVSNSLKFKSDQPIKIHIGAKPIEDGKVLFWVRDNGIGIDQKHQEKIFMIFQRLHSKSQYPGSGIGLAICRKIVERHGGKMWLDPTVTDGCQFFFTLPGTSHIA